MTFQITTKTEDAKGKVTVERTTVYGEEAASQERARLRELTPTGQTREITIERI